MGFTLAIAVLVAAVAVSSVQAVYLAALHNPLRFSDAEAECLTHENLTLGVVMNAVSYSSIF